MLIIVLGRGNSGTRIISDTLSKSGVYMGPVNEAGDMIPPNKMYKAAQIAGKYVKFKHVNSWSLGEHPWDYSNLISTEPTSEFKSLINEYIQPISNSSVEHKGWKIPETILSTPWIFKMFPDAYYIYWIRDPRDVMVTAHVTDNLSLFNVPCNMNNSIYYSRLESWIYQRDIMLETPSPQNIIQIKFEDFVLNQTVELNRLSNFLQMDLQKVSVDSTQIGRHKSNHNIVVPDVILDRYGYKS